MKKFGVMFVGLLLIVLGAFLLINGTKEEKKCTKEVKATVVDVQVKSRSKSNGTRRRTYYPVVEYKVDNTKVTKKSTFGTSKRNKYAVGNKVTILYNPNNIDSFVIKGEHKSLKSGIVCIILGIVVVIGGFKTSDKKEVTEEKIKA